MATVDTTDLTALTEFSGDELFYVVDDDDGTPVPRKMTVENLALTLFKQGSAAAGVEIGDLSKAISTKTDGGTYIGVELSPSITFTTTAGGDIVFLHAVPAITATANMGEIVGLQFQPTITGAGTIDAIHGIEALLAIGAPTTLARGVWSQIAANLGTTALGVSFEAEGQEGIVGTLTTYVGLRVRCPTAGGQIGTAVALRADELTDVATPWGLQIGDYLSQHVGMLGLGGATAQTAPAYGLDIRGTAQDRGCIFLAESTATPTNPPSSSGVVTYHRGDKLCHAFNNAGTMRYFTLDLTQSGATATWAQSTTAPT